MTTSTDKLLDRSWIVIVNPNAGTKKGEKDWHSIHSLLKDQNISFQEFFTDKKEHAVSITQESIRKGHRNFLVVGGDGTLNEVVNGIFNQDEVSSLEFLVGMIPVGTGNDWCRMFHVPFKYKQAVELIKKNQVFCQDIGRVSYYEGKEKKVRFFINVAGMGYDAIVAEKTNKDKSEGRGGPLVYFKNLFTSLLFYKYSKTEIYLDGKVDPITNQTFSLSVGICKYNGGGMMQLPEAIPNDGILNMTVIKKLGKLTVLRKIKKLYDGSFIHHPKVDTWKGKSFRVVSDPLINIETDGESLGHSPFDFDILPLSLNVLVNQPSEEQQ